MEYWEIIADKLNAAGWSWGCISSVSPDGPMFIVDAQSRDGQRYIVRADEKLNAFLELEEQITHA